MYVDMCLSIFECTYAHTTHTSTLHTRTQTRAHTHTCTNTHIYIHTRTHIHAHTHARTHAHTHTHTHTHTHIKRACLCKVNTTSTTSMSHLPAFLQQHRKQRDRERFSSRRNRKQGFCVNSAFTFYISETESAFQQHTTGTDDRKCQPGNMTTPHYVLHKPRNRANICRRQFAFRAKCGSQYTETEHHYGGNPRKGHRLDYE